MNQGRYVFSQLMDFASRYEFDKCVERYNGDHRARSFKCWQQFLCLSFGQLSHRESLRDIVLCLGAQATKMYHLGFKGRVTRSTLSDANQRRDWRIYADFAKILMAEARKLYIDEPEFSLEISNSVYALDSSLIRLCVTVYNWADYRKTTAGIKLHTLLDVQNALPEMVIITAGKVNDMRILEQVDFKPSAFYIMDRGYNHLKQLDRIEQRKAYFVIRSKNNVHVKVLQEFPLCGQRHILSDRMVVFKNYYSGKAYPRALRLIKSKDPETGKHILLLTNHLGLKAETIAELYRQRWKIELFFKWIKQNLRIKVFWGESENAVKTQIWIALATYLLVAIARKRLNIKLSLYEIFQILSVSLFDKTPIDQLFTLRQKQDDPSKKHNQLSIFDL